ncbi:MAG: hypothetical protein LHV68_06340 [Elusimicrobia bacterium]|nr:hypothetical protein [Candidatus Liberimonas magnetica]
MKTKVGLWIDKKKAVIISISDKGEEIKVVNSNMEKYFQPSNGNFYNNDFGRKDFPAYDIVKRDMEMHIQKFYDKIISLIHNADPVFIFGPGQIKIGLRKKIESNKSMTRNVKIENADKLPYSGILKRVRDHYFSHINGGDAQTGYMPPAGIPIEQSQ